MKVVLLCGGKGTRLREITEKIPKPLVEIGGRPILWHIMKIYSYYGFKDFILCLGYKGNMIKKYFLEHQKWKFSNFTIKFSSDKIKYEDEEVEDWNITFVDTGLETNTGGRIKKIEKYIDTDNFLVNYGDGLSNVNIKELVDFHNKHGKTATVTCVKPATHYGVIKLDKDNVVASFNEKPNLDIWVNGGFFVFNKKIFDYLEDNSILEREPFKKLSADKQMVAYLYNGFWKCMDTYKDREDLNEMWKCNDSPWKVW